MNWLMNNFEIVLVAVAGAIILAGFVSNGDAGQPRDDGLDPIRPRHGGMDARVAHGMDTRMYAYDWEGGSKHGGMKMGPE